MGVRPRGGRWLLLLALLLWLRVVRNRWLSLRITAVSAPPASEETGIWGVGGPGMRNPGATGIFGPYPARRSTDQPPDSHNPR